MSLTLARLGIVAGSFPIAAAGGDFESIATVTVPSGGAATVSFTNIPSTYTHLHLRALWINTNGANGTYAQARVNSDTGSNYSWHSLHGEGTSAGAFGIASQSYIQFGPYSSSNNNSYPLALVCDIVDYADTAKNTTIRSFVGNDSNGDGSVDLRSGLWMNTSAVTGLDVYAFSQGTASTFGQHTTFALYGIKA